MGLLVARLAGRRQRLLAIVVAAVTVAVTFRPVAVSGGYPSDVELIEPVTKNQNNNNSPSFAFQTVYYYPSYVKGGDPVEEYNRRRLHVDTSDYVKGIQRPPDGESKKLLESSLQLFKLKYVKPDYFDYKWPHDNTKGKSDKFSKKKKHYEKPIPGSQRKFYQKVKGPIKRLDKVDPGEGNNSSETNQQASINYPKRYEESDPHVFAYGRSEPEESVDNRRQANLPEDVKYFQ